MSQITLQTDSAEKTIALGERLGSFLHGGEVLQLVSDVGGGKTTLVKGIAKGMGSTETVQSPTFIVSALYECADVKRLYHYDFYRLNDAGIMSDQLAESLSDPMAVSIIEWGDIVSNVLPKNVITIKIRAKDENARSFEFTIPDEHAPLLQALKELA